jgi:hypothetical protein
MNRRRFMVSIHVPISEVFPFPELRRSGDSERRRHSPAPEVRALARAAVTV